MLYRQRQAVAKMSPAHAAAHRLLWRAYQPVARFAVARRLWGLYRRTWPK